MKSIRDETGTQRHIGYVVEIVDGKVRVVLDINEHHMNRGDSLHGGIMATLLDAAAGYAVSLSVDGERLYYTNTVSLTIDYISRVREGRVIATARAKGGGRKIVFVDAKLNTEDGSTVATAAGVFKLYPDEQRG